MTSLQLSLRLHFCRSSRSRQSLQPLFSQVCLCFPAIPQVCRRSPNDEVALPY